MCGGGLSHHIYQRVCAHEVKRDRESGETFFENIAGATKVCESHD